MSDEKDMYDQVVEMEELILNALIEHEDIRGKQEEYQDEDSYIADKLWTAGYRLDPYPNGKTKDQLMAQTAAVQANLDRASILLHGICTSIHRGEKIDEGHANTIAAFLKDLAKDSTGEPS